MEITLAKMVSLLIFVWLLAWTPYVILSTWIMFFNAKGLSPVLGVIPTVCCKISAGANALLYGLRYLSFLWQNILINSPTQFNLPTIVNVANPFHSYHKVAEIQSRNKEDDSHCLAITRLKLSAMYWFKLIGFDLGPQRIWCIHVFKSPGLSYSREQ